MTATREQDTREFAGRTVRALAMAPVLVSVCGAGPCATNVAARECDAVRHGRLSQAVRQFLEKARHGGRSVRVKTSVSDMDSRDQLVMEHVPLVKTLAQRLARRLPPQVEMNDLVSVGVLGLIEAANRYRPSLGVPFDAFARRRVNGAMLDKLRELDWAPRSLRRLRREMDAAVSSLRHRLGREPREEEIADAMDLSVPAFEKALERLRALEVGSVRQLDAPTSDGTPLVELCIDPSDDAATQLEHRDLKAHLAAAIEELPERERHILALYYQEELTLAEIGEVIGVCESRVSQLRSLAISRLRTLLRRSFGLAEAA